VAGLSRLLKGSGGRRLVDCRVGLG
jgi:hypothetical protein